MKITKTGIICIVLALLCLCLTVTLAFALKNDNNKESLSPAGMSAKDIQFCLALSAIYKQASEITLTLPFTTITMTQTAVTRSFIGKAEADEAITEMNKRVDRTLNSAFEAMGEVEKKFEKLLKEYNISSGSSYTSKLSSLKKMFASLKNSSTELISRTRTFIRMIDGDYDAYYTNYLEQLSDLSGKIESYSTSIENEYNALMSKISDSYDIIK